MRRLIFAAVATVAVAAAGSLASAPAHAMTLPGLAGAPASQTEPVALVCRRVWNGFAWVRSCYRTGPRYYGPGYGYYGPRPYYGHGGPRMYRRGYYRY